MEKRNIDIVVLSDLHLGTHGCRAEELWRYLENVNPGQLILNGDIIDIWQFRKNYWPESHRKVLNKLLDFITSDIPVYYLTGNHDELLRKYTKLKLANFELRDKLVLNIDGKKAWIFHGDVFDVTMQYSKWLAKLGAIGYDILIILNHVVNFFSEKMGKGRISISKKIKDSVKSAVKYISDFEQTATDLAIANGYDYVICGHIHQPRIDEYKNEDGSVLYLNSGDWIENLTSLEFYDKEWHIYRYEEETVPVPVESDISTKLPKKSARRRYYDRAHNNGVSEQMMYLFENLRQ